MKIGEARPTLEPLLNNLKNVIYPNQTAIINTGTTLSSLVPIRSNFYFYQGSATDPKCPEAVTWIVYDTIQTLSDDQMSRFRNVSRDRRGELVIKNWRFLQPRNDRNIGYHSNAVISTYYDVMGLLG